MPTATSATAPTKRLAKGSGTGRGIFPCCEWRMSSWPFSSHPIEADGDPNDPLRGRYYARRSVRNVSDRDGAPRKGTGLPLLHPDRDG